MTDEEIEAEARASWSECEEAGVMWNCDRDVYVEAYIAGYKSRDEQG